MGIDDLFKGELGTTLAIGVGALIILPAAVKAAKPLLKMAIKGGLVAYGKGREAFHDVSEVVEDIVAEAKYELSAESGQPLMAVAGGGHAEEGTYSEGEHHEVKHEEEHSSPHAKKSSRKKA